MSPAVSKRDLVGYLHVLDDVAEHGPEGILTAAMAHLSAQAIAVWLVPSGADQARLLHEAGTAAALTMLKAPPSATPTAGGRSQSGHWIQWAYPAAGNRAQFVVVTASTGDSATVGDSEFGACANATAMALRIASRENTTEHVALSGAAQRLHSSLDLASVLGNICLEAAQILEAEIAAVYRQHGDSVVLEAVHGMGPEVIGLTMKSGLGLAGKVLATGRPAWTDDYEATASTDQARTGDASPFISTVKAALAVPIRSPNGDQGVVSLGWQRRHRVTADHISLLESVAELAGTAFANAEAFSNVNRVARTDTLTGCLNRTGFTEVIDGHLAGGDPEGTRLSVVMLDLNRFKEVNDRLGHLAGDDLLVAVAEAFTRALRPGDALARLGGDEFAIALPGAGETEAVGVASRAIEAATLVIAEVLTDLTGAGAVAGAAAWRDGHDRSATDLLNQADRGLYYAKRDRERGECVGASRVPPTFMPESGLGVAA